MEEFQVIGSIRIPIRWIFIGLALVAAYVAMKLRLREIDLNKKQLRGTLFNALFYGFIIWKLSYVLFNPFYTYANPLGILYFNGGQRGVLIGILLAIVYVYIQSTKQNIRIRMYIDLFITGWFAASATYFIYAIENHILYYSGQILLSILCLIVIAKNDKRIGHLKNITNIVLIYSLGQIFLTMM